MLTVGFLVALAGAMADRGTANGVAVGGAVEGEICVDAGGVVGG